MTIRDRLSSEVLRQLEGMRAHLPSAETREAMRGLAEELRRSEAVEAERRREYLTAHRGREVRARG